MGEGAHRASETREGVHAARDNRYETEGQQRSNSERGPICACRRNAASPQSAAPARRLARRSSSAVSWALPSLGLALVPKCPMCIAAYLALGGGLGVSLSTASHLRIALLWLCWSVLALLTVRLAVRFAKTRIMRGAQRSGRVEHIRIFNRALARICICGFLYSIAPHNVRVYKARAQTADLKQFLSCSHSLVCCIRVFAFCCSMFLWARVGFPPRSPSKGSFPHR